jgi:hypothetical protein
LTSAGPRAAPGRGRPAGGSPTGAGGLGLAEPDSVWGAPPPAPPAAGRGAGAVGPDAGPGRGGRAAAGDAVAGRLSLRFAPGQRPPAARAACPPQGRGSAQTWRPWTPARAAGWTQHVGPLRAVLRCCGPPGPPPAGVCARRGAGRGKMRWPAQTPGVRTACVEGLRRGERAAGGHERPLIDAVLTLCRSADEPGVCIRSVQVHDLIRWNVGISTYSRD